jgi:glyoxylase I family protein
MDYHFHHVHILCSDLQDHIDFFTNNLGAQLVTHKKFGSADGATLDLNGTMINLRLAADHETIDDNAADLAYGYHHICVRVDDIDRAYNDLTGRGVAFLSTPKDAGGNRIAFFKGPDGIVLEMLQLF